MRLGKLMANVTNDKYKTGGGLKFVKCTLSCILFTCNALGKFEITT